jgi:DNA-binding NtrC family response regulator
MALVLCTGSDRDLLETRRKALEKAGHTVLLARNKRELQDACTRNKIEIAVLGSHMSENMKRNVTDLLREHCPASKVIELVDDPQGRAIEDADSWASSLGDLEINDRISELRRAS